MDQFFKFLPLILQIMDLIPKIQEALRAKTSVASLLQKLGPEVLPILQQLGKNMFPELSDALAIEAGALKVSPDVTREIQVGLNKLMITDDSGALLTIDGSYGEKTKQAVKKFQKAHSLEVDGWAGKVTQAAISSEVAKLPSP